VTIDPPRPSDIEVQVTAEGIRASIMQRVANVEGELRRFVAKYVARETSKPHVEEARLIDVSRAIDRAWGSIAPQRSDERVTDDLNEALESEIRENEDTFLEM
jgi:acyl-CoA reductase-like NAD-dependent aldehyde dehydrogenase